MQTKKKGYKYWVWGLATLIYIIVFFHRVALGVVKDDLIDVYGLAGSGEEGRLFALLGSMYMYAYMLMQIPTGVLADTLGPRKTIFLGSMVASIGTLFFALSDHLWVAFISRFAVGLGVAVVFVCVLKIITDWFPKERFATMSGVTSFIGNMGAILAMTPLVFINKMIGWQKALVTIAIIHMVLGVVCFFVIKEKEPSAQKEKVSIKEIKVGLLRVLKDKGIYPPMLAYGIIFGTSMALTGTWGVSVMEDIYHVSKEVGASMMSMVTLGVAVGCITIGKLSDRVGSRKKPMVWFVVAHLICWVLFLVCLPPQVILMPLLFILGFTGTSFVVSWAYAKERHPKAYAATAMSVVNFAGFLGGALVPQLIGIIYDAMPKDNMVQLWRVAVGVTTAVMGVACIWVLRI